MIRRQSLLVAAVALVLAACGGGSDGPSDAEVDAQIDQAMDDIEEVADSMAEPEAEPEPATEPEPAPESASEAESESEPPGEPEPEPEPEPAGDSPRCANVTGDMAEAMFEAVDCGEPHDAEFAAVVAAPAAPDDDPVAADIERSIACREPVEMLAGWSLTQYGPEVAYEIDEDAGELGCWVRSPAYGALTGSLTETDLDTALGDFVALSSIEPGECFLAAPENSGSISIGSRVDCTTPGADQILGTVTVDDGPYPGDQALFAIGDDECPAIAAAASFDIIGDTASTIYMFETEWTAFDIRDLICTSYRAIDVAFCTLDDPEGDENLYDEQVPCSEPHTAEFAGYIDPPVDVLPETREEAGFIIRQACRESVEALAQRTVSRPGVGVGFFVASGLGDPITDRVECYAEGDGVDLLVGSMLEGGIDAAYGDVEVLADLEPGTCFTFAGDAFNVGYLADCGDDGALVVIGNVEADPGEYPGEDALRAVRTERCTALLATSGLSVDESTISGTFPGENSWTAFDRRLITCDATPA